MKNVHAKYGFSYHFKKQITFFIKYYNFCINFIAILLKLYQLFGTLKFLKFVWRVDMKAIVNGKIILKDRIMENSALLFSDVIEGIVPEDKIPEGAVVIDAKGGFVSPGLIDLHIHGYLGKDVCDGEEESIRVISEGLLKNGVTGYLPTTMTVDMKVIRKALEICRGLKEESKTWNGSEILGCHAEGPFISESKKGAQDARYILKPDAAFVKEYADIIITDCEFEVKKTIIKGETKYEA